jgi:undecaprenyl-diphosphatase
LDARAALLTALVWADPLDPKNLGPIDTWWHDLVVPAGSLATAFARGLAIVGGDPVSIAIRVVVAAWLAVRRRWADLIAWIVAAAIADVLVATLKSEVGRMRPDGSDLRSFPSGHAKYAAQLAVGLALLLTPRTRHRATAWGAAVAWIVLMAWSRTALDVHHLSDVVAGASIGGGAMFGAWALTHGGLARRAEVAPDSPT